MFHVTYRDEVMVKDMYIHCIISSATFLHLLCYFKCNVSFRHIGIAETKDSISGTSCCSSSCLKIALTILLTSVALHPSPIREGLESDIPVWMNMLFKTLTT